MIPYYNVFSVVMQDSEAKKGKKLGAPFFCGFSAVFLMGFPAVCLDKKMADMYTKQAGEY